MLWLIIVVDYSFKVTDEVVPHEEVTEEAEQEAEWWAKDNLIDALSTAHVARNRG